MTGPDATAEPREMAGEPAERFVDSHSSRRAWGRGLVHLGLLLTAALTLNVLVSGVLDWSRGEPIQLPLPPPFDRWHLLSSVALVTYLVVHVWHRRKRLRRSTIQ